VENMGIQRKQEVNETLTEIIQIGAEYMAKERPDLYTVDKARIQIWDWMNECKTKGYEFVASGSFTMLYYKEEHEFELLRNVVSIYDFPPVPGDQDEPAGFNWL